MGISFYPERKLFTLNADGCTYAMMIHPQYNRLIHLYYGPELPGDEAFRLFEVDDIPRGHSPIPAEGNPEGGSLNNLPQELSSFGVGDFRCASAKVRTPDGFNATDAVYVSHRIFCGKPELPGLPATFALEEEVESLEIILADPVTNVEFVLLYSAFRRLPVITRSCRVINRGSAAVTVEKIASWTLDLPGGEYDLISFHGATVRERHLQRERVRYGIRVLSSGRGLSSHHMNPFFILCDPEAGETVGRAWGQMLVYSGSFTAEIERDYLNSVRVQFGLNPEKFSWKLEPGESFQSPEAVSAFSGAGFEALSHTFHDLLRGNLIRGPYVRSHRPIVINNWEATRFNFTEEQIIGFARRAAELGMEMLVLDDGWFGRRDDSSSSLGDWVVYREKLPGGLPALVEKVKSFGLKFGLWFEPEMVSPDSNLFRAHPDWCLHIAGRPGSTGRCQLVLDMGRREVVDYVFDSITAILDSADIEYIKLDANRPLTEAGSAVLPPDRQGEVMHRFVLGTYSLLERLRRRYPRMLIEGCASGGGRFDAGMLFYTPQIWTSDDTDAIERLYIQYGTSFAYPCSTMGAHVSDVPNRHTGRITPLATRGDVALAGAFGYEMDPGRFTAEEAEEVKRQIAARRETEELMLNGDYLRLGSPFTDNLVGWQFVSRDKSEFVVTAVRILSRPNPPQEYLRLRGLDPEAEYVDVEDGGRFSGAFLMHVGWRVPICQEDFKSFRRRFRKLDR